MNSTGVDQEATLSASFNSDEAQSAPQTNLRRRNEESHLVNRLNETISDEPNTRQSDPEDRMNDADESNDENSDETSAKKDNDNEIDDSDVTLASASITSRLFASSEASSRDKDRESISDSGETRGDLVQSDETVAEEDQTKADDTISSSSNKDYDDQPVVQNSTLPVNLTTSLINEELDDSDGQLSRRAFFGDKLPALRGGPLLSEIRKLRNQTHSKLFNNSSAASRRKRRKKRKKKFKTLSSIISPESTKENSNQKVKSSINPKLLSQLNKAMQTRQSSIATNGYSTGLNGLSAMADASLLSQLPPTPSSLHSLSELQHPHSTAAASQTISNVIKHRFPTPLSAAMQKLLLGKLATGSSADFPRLSINKQNLLQQNQPSSSSNYMMSTLMQNPQGVEYLRELLKQSMTLNRDHKGPMLPYESQLASNTLLKYTQAANQLSGDSDALNHPAAGDKLIPVEIIGLDPAVTDSILHNNHNSNSNVNNQHDSSLVDSQADATRVFESIGAGNSHDAFRDTDVVSAAHTSDLHQRPSQKPSSVFHIHHYHHTKSSPSNIPRPQADTTETSHVQERPASPPGTSEASATSDHEDQTQIQDDNPKPPQQVLVNDRGQLVYMSMNDANAANASGSQSGASAEGQQTAAEDESKQTEVGFKRPMQQSEPSPDSEAQQVDQTDDSDSQQSDEVQRQPPRDYGRDQVLVHGQEGQEYFENQMKAANRHREAPMRSRYPSHRHNSSRLVRYQAEMSPERLPNSYWQMQDVTGAQATNDHHERYLKHPAHPLLMVSYRPQQQVHANSSIYSELPAGLRRYPYNEGSESKSSLVAAKGLLGTKHLQEATNKLLSSKNTSNLGQMLAGNEAIHKGNMPQRNNGYIVGTLDNYDRLNKSQPIGAISSFGLPQNTSATDSMDNIRVPNLLLPFKSQTVPLLTHFGAASNKTIGSSGRHYSPFNASSLTQPILNLPESSVVLRQLQRQIAAHNLTGLHGGYPFNLQGYLDTSLMPALTSLRSHQQNATKLSNEELLSLLHHLKHLNNTLGSPAIGRPAPALIRLNTSQRPPGDITNLSPITGVRKITATNGASDIHGFDMNATGGEIKQMIDQTSTTTAHLTDASGIGNLALAFIFFVSMLTFVVIAASLIYRRRRVIRSSGPSSATEAPNADSCSGPYSSNRGRLNLAQRTKHFMRSNFATPNNQPTSLKSLSLYDTNGSNNNSDAVSDDGKKLQRLSNGNCKLNQTDSAGTNKISSHGPQCSSSNKFFSASRWATKNKSSVNPKGLASFNGAIQSDMDNDLSSCSHHHSHHSHLNHHHSVESAPPIRTLNTRTQKASYLKSLISAPSAAAAAAEGNHTQQEGAIRSIKTNQVSGSIEGDKLQQNTDVSETSLKKPHLNFVRLTQSTKVPKYLNIKHGSNDCHDAYRLSSSSLMSPSADIGKAKDATGSSVQDVSSASGGLNPSTKLTDAPGIATKRIGVSSGRKSQLSMQTDLSNGIERMTHERISSPSVTSSFVLQSTGEISPDSQPERGTCLPPSDIYKKAPAYELRSNRIHRLSTIRSIGFERGNLGGNKSVSKRSNSLHEVVQNLKLGQNGKGPETSNTQAKRATTNSVPTGNRSSIRPTK